MDQDDLPLRLIQIDYIGNQIQINLNHLNINYFILNPNFEYKNLLYILDISKFGYLYYYYILYIIYYDISFIFNYYYYYYIVVVN